MNILVTGSAGFIGYHLSYNLLMEGHNVWGVDNMNHYYSVTLKELRNKRLEMFDNYDFSRMDINSTGMKELFNSINFDVVVNLAAQAGVRYSITNPKVYMDSNMMGFFNILELCRNNHVKLVYASSSSVYGGIREYPFSEDMDVSSPISLYAATKKANELMAHTYSHLYGFDTIGLRFFTVYGPMGRPDMMMWLTADAIRNGTELSVFNHGVMERDFTYVDDIVSGIKACVENQPKSPYNVYNLGNNKPEKLMDVVGTIEKYMGAKATKKFVSMQDGDVLRTCANIDKAKEDLGYEPKTSIDEGIEKFIEWYKGYVK